MDDFEKIPETQNENPEVNQPIETNQPTQTDTNVYNVPYSVRTTYTPNSAYGSYHNDSQKKASKRAATVILAVFLSIIVSLSTSIGVFKLMNYGQSQGPNNTPSSQISNNEQNSVPQNITITGETDSAAEAIYLKAEKSVVGIRTTASVKNFFGGVTEATGEGSGVIYSSDGYIITNYHVIADNSSGSKTTAIEVIFPDDLNNPVSATLIGYNVSADIAVLKIERSGLAAAVLGNASEIRVGQNVVAIGSPGGIEFIGSASYGIISGLNRSITIESLGTMKLIQTDAAINPGNSGGGLFNTKGELIGITSSKLVSTNIEGMGFAIPIDTTLEVVTDIIENKDNPTPYIGVEIYPYSSEYLARYQLPAGAAIKSVIKGGPAETAGIKAGDIIVEFNGVDINEYTEFGDVLDKCEVGQRVTVKIYRSGRYYTTNITIGSNNGQ